MSRAFASRSSCGSSMSQPSSSVVEHA
jgi:hypothetical protein